MPLYEYECKACKKPFEKLVRSMTAMKDDAEKVACPTCGSKKTARKHSVFAAQSGGAKAATLPQGGGCGRCGGPGPCGLDG